MALRHKKSISNGKVIENLGVFVDVSCESNVTH